MTNQINKLVKAVYKNKYFYPVLIVLGFCLATFIMMYAGSSPFLYQIKESDISLRVVYAPYEFTYPTTVDKEETEKLREEFEAKVLPVYDIDASVQEKAFSKIDIFFDTTEKFDDPERARKISKDILENIFLVGVVKETDKEGLLGRKVKKVLVRNPVFDIERAVNTTDLVDEREAKKIVRDMLERILPKEKPLRASIYDIVKEDVSANTAFNSDQTNKRKEEARKQVLPVYNRTTVKKNELVVNKGERLTKEHIAKLTQITRIHAIANRTSYLSGFLILIIGLVLIGLIYFVLFDRKIIQTPKSVLLISINAFLTILAAVLIIQYQQAVYLIPLAGMAMILVLLINTGAAFVTTLLLSIYIGFMAGGKLNLTVMLFVGCIAGIYLVKGARRRSQIFFAGFGVAVINFFSLIGIGLLNNLPKEAILRDGFYGAVNGIISGFIVIGLLPVFEYVFDLVTNITLLELSDLSNPLLKELTIKAPGTYHHSILVGNLAEEACNAIGANSLLARVGAYYHDIGKIEKAEYFVENQMGTSSKHEKLAPSMSALIITNHAKDGVELAKKYKLKKAIVDFISQHHGTSLIYYFYQRALEKVKTESELKEEEFRYPGPKPQTKETAIVLLADSVEASSRMLNEPTPARIKGLVQKIINNKFIDGQLDECDLTLKDLNKISDSFVRVLTGVFHTRLEYPESKTVKKEKKSAENKSKQPKQK